MGFPGSLAAKNLPAKQETRLWSLGREDPLEKEMATHSNIPDWEITWTEGSWWAAVHGVAESDTRHDVETKQQQEPFKTSSLLSVFQPQSLRHVCPIYNFQVIRSMVSNSLMSVSAGNLHLPAFSLDILLLFHQIQL